MKLLMGILCSLRVAVFMICKYMYFNKIKKILKDELLNKTKSIEIKERFKLMRIAVQNRP